MGMNVIIFVIIYNAVEIKFSFVIDLLEWSSSLSTQRKYYRLYIIRFASSW